MCFRRKKDKEQLLLAGKKRVEELAEKAVYLVKTSTDETFALRLNKFADNLKYAKTGVDSKMSKLDHKIECGLDDIKIAITAGNFDKANKILSELEELLLQREKLR